MDVSYAGVAALPESATVRASQPAAAVCGAASTIPALRRDARLWRYEFPCDRLVQALKYRARLALPDSSRETSVPPIPEVDLIVPMPLHPKRLAGRGFNQALEIARGFARHLGRPIEPRGVLRVEGHAAADGTSLRGAGEERARSVPVQARSLGSERRRAGRCHDDRRDPDELARALKRAGATRVETS